MKQILVVGNHEIMLDEEDYNSLPSSAVFFLDKDEYCCMRFVSRDVRKMVCISLHRWVMHNPHKLLVDHINGNKQDNRKINLRPVTRQQNSQNRGISNTKGRTSIYKGVCVNRHGAWSAQIKVKGKSKHLGTFKDEKLAALAYNKAAIQHFGDYAFLNIIGL